MFNLTFTSATIMRVLILLALIGAAFAVPRTVQRIVGGSDTSIEEYPYMANMQYGIWYSYQACGGSLVTEAVVLSAAHCYLGDAASSWKVILGSSLLTGSDGVTHTVSRLTVHEDYSPWTTNNDIAIVHLTIPAVLSNKIGLGSIAGPNYNLVDGTVVTAIGWGATDSSGSQPTQLQHVDVAIINQEICADRYKNHNTVTDGMFCQGVLDVGGKDACHMDAGGPVVHGAARNILVGVMSWGIGCGDAFYPGVNTKVNYYVDWILQNAVA